MSYKCVFCEKKPVSGKSVSHSKRATNRVFRPNLQRVKIKLNGTVQRAYVCTKCLKLGKVEKVKSPHAVFKQNKFEN